jgi:protein-S-isoprenylcysteine O-methyltransferase Ste14
LWAGPYAVTRHPIYSGLLLACLGTALAGGEWRCIVGMAMILLAFAIKIGKEEHLMMETFPEAYRQYRRRVKALIPGVF